MFVVLLAVLVVSSGVEVGYRWRGSDGVPRGVTVRQGQLWVWRDPMLATPRLGLEAEKALPARLSWGFEDWQIPGMPGVARLVAVPLWWGVAGVGVPVAGAWGWRLLPSRRRARRRARGLCWKCGYELRGLGVCPECGAEDYYVR